MIKLSIIIPVYNEESLIRQVIERVASVKIEGVEKELIVIDDKSTDRTREILSSITLPYIQVICQDSNQGKGAAIREGLRHVSGDIIVIQDGDMEYDPHDYIDLIRPILDGNASVVYGSRIKNPSAHNTMFARQWIANKFLTWLTNKLYGSSITDMETCYKMFKKETIQNISLESNRFDFEPEITAKIIRQGYTISEVPISYAGRGYREGKKIRFKDGLMAVISLIKYRVKT